MNRRHFLKAAGLSGFSAFLAACRLLNLGQNPTVAISPRQPTFTPTVTSTPLIAAASPAPTSTPLLPPSLSADQHPPAPSTPSPPPRQLRPPHPYPPGPPATGFICHRLSSTVLELVTRVNRRSLKRSNWTPVLLAASKKLHQPL